MIPVIFAILILDPAATKAERSIIAERISNLSHPRFAVRERSARVLSDFGSMAKPALRAAMIGNADTESLNRLQTIHNRIVDQEMESLAPFPCIDAWWYDVNERAYHNPQQFPVHARLLEIAVPDDSPSWPRWRAATKLWVRAKLTDGSCGVRWLRLLLAAMHARDEVFIGNSDPKSPHIVNWRTYLAGAKR